jgi:hypothetical protein
LLPLNPDPAREDAMAELACSYADMEAMQATLADSAVYVRYLRRKVGYFAHRIQRRGACVRRSVVACACSVFEEK